MGSFQVQESKRVASSSMREGRESPSGENCRGGVFKVKGLGGGSWRHQGLVMPYKPSFLFILSIFDLILLTTQYSIHLLYFL